jgi:hypothetical protein
MSFFNSDTYYNKSKLSKDLYYSVVIIYRCLEYNNRNPIFRKRLYTSPGAEIILILDDLPTLPSRPNILISAKASRVATYILFISSLLLGNADIERQRAN